MENPKDLLGQPITKGCLIAYANLIGRSANQCVYEITDVVEVEEHSWGHTETVFKLKAKALSRSYSSVERPVTLSRLERVVVLPDSYRELITK